MKIKVVIILIIVICLILTIKFFPVIKYELQKKEYSNIGTEEEIIKSLEPKTFDELVKEYSNIQTEEELMEKLESKTFDELLDEINIFSAHTSDGPIHHAYALMEKAKNVSDERIQAEILNEKNSLAARTILIQISPSIDAHLDVNIMENILFDDNTDFTIRHNALLYLYQIDSISIELLEKLSSGSDEDLAFQANKVLKWINKAK